MWYLTVATYRVGATGKMDRHDLVEPKSTLTRQDRYLATLSFAPVAVLTIVSAVAGILLVHAQNHLAPAAFIVSSFFLVLSVAVPLAVASELRIRKTEKSK